MVDPQRGILGGMRATSLARIPVSVVRALGRALRRVFGPLSQDAWIYIVFPTLYIVAEIVTENEPVEWFVRRFAAAFTIFACLGLPMHLTYEHLGQRLLPAHFRWSELPVHAAVIGASVLLGTQIAIGLIFLFGDSEALAQVSSEQMSDFRHVLWLGGFMGGGIISGVGRAIRLYQHRAVEAEARAALAQRASLLARVEALQARIQPHFLFNALNTVAGLIEEDPERAEAAVEKLSDLFRYTLDAGRQPTVSLEQELAVVRDYLDLEALRYGARLETAVSVDASVHEDRIPPLILQPVVENAVLHGVAKRREGGRLEVEARADGARVRLSVEDDGPGPGQSTHAGARTALADLRKRVGLLYGDAATLREDSGPLGGYRLQLWLPRDSEVSRT